MSTTSGRLDGVPADAVGLAPAPPKRGSGREALCQAVVRLVAAKGLDAVTLRSVAAEAGVSYGLPSYHFGTREEMIKQAFVWAAERAVRDTHMDYSDASSLARFVDRLPDLVDERPESSIFQIELALGGLRDPDLRTLVQSVYSQYVSTVEESLQRFGVPDDRGFARLVMGAIIGLNVQALIFPNDPDVRSAYQALRDVIGDRVAEQPKRARHR